MILSGELKDFSLADVLQLLLQQRKSGVLALENTREKAELFISQGNITGVRVNGETPEAKIREMLVESGRVGKQEIAELESISRGMDRPLLNTLVAKGFLTEEDKEEWQQIIAEDMVCELFGWLTGRYEFGTGLKGQTAGAGHVNLKLSTEFACMEGMRRIDEWPRLKETLTNDKAVFRPTGRPFDGDQQGWDHLVLGMVDGRRSVVQIAKQVPFGSFRLSECLVNLWDGGFIAPVENENLEHEAPAHSDPESERDRKTAMVLGISVLFFVFATAVRLVSIWMTGAGISATDLSATAETNIWSDYEEGITHVTARDNAEAFLIDYAARLDKLPSALEPLTEEGALTPGEISGRSGPKLFYRKTTEKAFILK